MLPCWPIRSCVPLNSRCSMGATWRRSRSFWRVVLVTSWLRTWRPRSSPGRFGAARRSGPTMGPDSRGCWVSRIISLLTIGAPNAADSTGCNVFRPLRHISIRIPSRGPRPSSCVSCGGCRRRSETRCCWWFGASCPTPRQRQRLASRSGRFARVSLVPVSGWRPRSPSNVVTPQLATHMPADPGDVNA